MSAKQKIRYAAHECEDSILAAHQALEESPEDIRPTDRPKLKQIIKSMDKILGQLHRIADKSR